MKYNNSYTLGLALKECMKLGIKKVLITCDKYNIASAKTIINNGGKLVNEVTEGNRITKIYCIDLCQKYIQYLVLYLKFRISYFINTINERMYSMNKPINQNAKQALNMLKMEIANEQGYNYNPVSDKIESNAPQNTIEGISKNVLAGEQVGGAMTKSLVSKGEEILLQMYKDK